MAEWASRTRAILKDIFGESSLMVKQIELWRLALMRGNTAKFESMLNDVEERLEGSVLIWNSEEFYWQNGLKLGIAEFRTTLQQPQDSEVA
jgi:hypothetical protein